MKKTDHTRVDEMNGKKQYHFSYFLNERMSITSFIRRLGKVDGMIVNKIYVSEDIDADCGMHVYGDEEYTPDQFREGVLHTGSWGTSITVSCTWNKYDISFWMLFSDEAYHPFDWFGVISDTEDFELPDDFEL